MQKIVTPDYITDGKLPDGPTLVYDEVVSTWADRISERWKMCKKLMRLGTNIILAHKLTQYDIIHAALVCIFTGEKKILTCIDVVMATQREPNDALYQECL